MLQADGFEDQTMEENSFMGFDMVFPSKHVIAAMFEPGQPQHQPYREAGLIRVIAALELLGRKGRVIDIGANIGDTLAIICKYSTLQTTCIEASDFFFSFLEENHRRNFSGRSDLRHCFVTSSSQQKTQALFHWAGTAKAIDAPFTENCPAVPIGEIIHSSADLVLLKVDIDGLDIDVISGAIATMLEHSNGRNPSPILFELELPGIHQATNVDFSRKVIEFFETAKAAGYDAAFFWDDHGRFVGKIHCNDAPAVTNALNYMWHPKQTAFYGYDICLIQSSDKDLECAICDQINTDSLIAIS